MPSALQEFKHFMTLDLPLSESRIRDLFMSTHSSYQEKSTYWSVDATRKKVITEFWSRQVLLHFSIILGITTLIVLPFFNNWPTALVSVFIGGSISVATIFFFNYWPSYYSDFLPKLDTIRSEEKKLQQAADDMKRCKRTQFPIAALTIV